MEDFLYDRSICCVLQLVLQQQQQQSYIVDKFLFSVYSDRNIYDTTGLKSVLSKKEVFSVKIDHF